MHSLMNPSNQTKRRCVTHHTDCKQTEWEEGASTSLTFQTHGQSHTSHKQPKCHSPKRLQATTPGGGHFDKYKGANQPRVPAITANHNGSIARTTSEQATPKNRLLCRSRHSSKHAFETQLKRPIGIASRPSFQAIERSMLRFCGMNRVRQIGRAHV